MDNKFDDDFNFEGRNTEDENSSFGSEGGPYRNDDGFKSGETPSQPQGGTPDGVYQDPSEGVSYRYGVNAPSPVPQDDFQPAASTQPNGQQPQGGQDAGYRGNQNAGYGGYQAQNQAPRYGSSYNQGYNRYQNNYSSQGQPSGATPPPAYYGGQPPAFKKKAPKGIVVGLTLIICTVFLAAVVLVFYSVNKTDNPSGGTKNDGNTPNPNAPILNIVDNPDEKTGLSTVEITQMNLDSTVVINLYNKVSDSFGLSKEYDQHVGSGSGIVWSEDGYIITNAHVVYDSQSKKEYSRIEVVFHDGTTIESAEIIGKDEATDLAVIKVDKTGLSIAEFGDSSKLQLGERLVALGNAGGLSWTVTQGILSGTERDIYIDNYAIKCIQTDAAINPGNSGGPLINSFGQVIAINSAKYTNADNLGFAIPIHEAKQVLDELVKYGYPKGRVRLGITGESFNGLGFRIAEIQDSSCLKGTDAEPGDIITSFGGVGITDHATLSAELKKYKVGDSVDIELLKTDGSKKQYTIKVTLTEAKS